MKKSSLEKFARILRADPDMLARTEQLMGQIFGKRAVLEEIVLENQSRFKKALQNFEIRGRLTAESVSQTLLARLTQEDQELYQVLGRPDFTNSSSVQPVIKAALKLVDPPQGLFLKKEKAIKMLEQSPPPHLISALGVTSVGELFDKEDFWQVFASLRFVESRQWMNQEFLPQYRNLKPGDFERRPIKVIFMEPRWLEIAQRFIQKKYHNLSHLKELGLVFVIPLPVEIPGMLTQVFSLMLHYLNEISFYSRLTERYRRDEETFTEKFISMLRGDIGKTSDLKSLPGAVRWLIIQRYLAKDDPQDPRLFMPHVNPEAIHWGKAQDQLAAFSKGLESLEYDFWQELHWVGDFFPSEKEGELLVSFDLVDNIMSLVKKETLIKYFYHHQEALWNKIFREYIGSRDRLEELIVTNLDKGYIEFH
jgi:hypothetical protein